MISLPISSRPSVRRDGSCRRRGLRELVRRRYALSMRLFLKCLAVASVLGGPVTAHAQAPLPPWDAAVRDGAASVRPVGTYIGTNLGYAPCPSSLTVPDSVVLVGLAAGAADSVGAVVRRDAEDAEQWFGVALPRDPAWRMPMRVLSARCRQGRVAQLFVQRGAAYAVVFAEHPSAVGPSGFLRAAARLGAGPLSWRTTPQGTTLAP